MLNASTIDLTGVDLPRLGQHKGRVASVTTRQAREELKTTTKLITILHLAVELETRRADGRAYSASREYRFDQKGLAKLKKDIEKMKGRSLLPEELAMVNPTAVFLNRGVTVSVTHQNDENGRRVARFVEFEAYPALDRVAEATPLQNVEVPAGAPEPRANDVENQN